MILVHDEYGQPFQIDEGNPLYAEAQSAVNRGEDPVVVPLRRLVLNRQWGWWTVLKRQREWLQSVGIPEPTEHILENLDKPLPPEVLASLLQEFGSYLSRLEAIIGQATGRVVAYRESLSTAVAIATADMDGKATEKAKEAKAIAGSETLRETRRSLIEEEAILATAKGLRDAYKHAWDTVSRVITLRQGEQQLTRS